MRGLLFTGAAMLLGTAIVAPAMAEGPRASSENHWPGMQNAPTPALGATMMPQYAPAEPHYVWQEGYDRRGDWRGHWTLVQ
jgi:hypothetical protein